jgi:metallophosphoesterase (TIGR03767 family)
MGLGSLISLTMKRLGAALLVLAAVAASAFASGATAQVTSSEPCGVTTLDATLQIDDETGILECAPGEPLVVREDFAPAGADRLESRAPLTAFYAMADVQLADEESPARGEGADPCGSFPGVSESAFRPHETMVPHLMNAHVRAADAVARAGSPVLGLPLDFVVGLGDLADNQQYNEIRSIIDIFDGGKLVDPDTGDDPVLGGEGYDGPQANDPTGAGDRSLSDRVPAGSVLEAANEPFWATGLHDGVAQLPWYSLPGNHDVKVQGTIPDELTGHAHDDLKGWRAVYRSYYTGHLKVVAQDLPPDQKQRLCDAFENQDEEAFMALLTEILGNPEPAARKVIPSDPARMPLYRSQEIKQPGDEEACLAAAAGREVAEHACTSSWIDEHRITTGVPAGHGYGPSDEESERCRDEDGNLLERACYSFDEGLFHYIALDSNPPEGFEGGNIDPEQFAWLERELIAHSTIYYDEDGNEITNPDGENKLLVMLVHHTMTSMDNRGSFSGGPGTSPGVTAEELTELLLRFPNVVMQADGHTHQNKIWAHGADDERADTGFWEVNTSAIADLPHQSRTIEVADNRDGTLSLFAVVVDALTGPDAAHIDWAAHDHTHEVELSEGAVDQNINEDWLASWGREVGFYDPQGDLTKTGTPEDRNVELLLPAPEWLDAEIETTLTYTGDTSGQVGQRADVSAILETASGDPVAGVTLAFERAGQRATATTDDQGEAATTLRIAGPPGSGEPITVTFGGTDNLLPAEILVEFEATRPGNQSTSPAPREAALVTTLRALTLF